MASEIRKKDARIDTFLESNNLDGVLISQRDNFAWATCGGFSGVDKSVQGGAVDLLFFNNRKYVIASEIEKYRFMDEELKDKGFELVSCNWYEQKEKALLPLIAGKKVASDSGLFGTWNLYSSFKRIRYSLVEEEVDKLRELSMLSAAVMNEVCGEIRQGDSEFEIGANLTCKFMKHGAQVPVCLIAADERVWKYRHPIPTSKRVKDYVMVVFCVEKYGLIVSMTRIVSFTKLTEDLRKKHKACLEVDAAFITNTKAGSKVSDIFKAGVEAYCKSGYPDEWKYHHQGGAAGYGARDYVADFDIEEMVVENQMFAWNPSITGTKSEDTILVTADGQEVLTNIDGWPMIKVQAGDRIILRPDILIK